MMVIINTMPELEKETDDFGTKKFIKPILGLCLKPCFLVCMTGKVALQTGLVIDICTKIYCHQHDSDYVLFPIIIDIGK
jgi:hypothetical protein